MSIMSGVSIYCITYNHCDYLAATLDSFLLQKTDFPVEILVHDDASTDGTTEILRKYEERYQDRIRVFYEAENQYSKGTDYLRLMLKSAQGKYIAFCEGDDLWLDDKKLQKQYEALEAHPECDMSACWGCTTTEDGKREISQIRPRIGDGILPAEDVILGGGQYLVSAGLFYRTEMCKQQMAFEKVIGLDYAMQIRGALRGGIWYIDEKMATYRRYSKSSWTNSVLKNLDRLKEHWKYERKLLEILDEETNGRYHDVITQRLKAYTTFGEQLDDRKDAVIAAISVCTGKRYLWGLGRRGQEFEGFCREQGIVIDGVCDAVNANVGELTACGNRICSTGEVLREADVILVSNRFAYEDLEKTDFGGKLVDLQEFMPFG